jgi:AcrR family transcriptional regulator
MPRTEFRTAKSARTYERTLETATRLFREKGFAATTMRDIARESGLGLGALYYYFTSKEEIILHFYAREGDRAAEAFAERFDTMPARLPEAVAEHLRMRLELLEPHREILRVAMKEAVDRDSPLCPFHPASRAVLEQNLGLFGMMVERTGAAKGSEVADWARSLWLGQLGIIGYWLFDRSPDYAMTHRAIDLFAQMVRLGGTLSRLPGIGTVRRQLFALAAPLFEYANETAIIEGRDAAEAWRESGLPPEEVPDAPDDVLSPVPADAAPDALAAGPRR